MTTITRYIYIPKTQIDLVGLCFEEGLKSEGFDLSWGSPAQPWLVRGTKIKEKARIATTCYWTVKRGALPWRESALDPKKARYLAIVTTVNANDDHARQLAELTNDRLLALYRQYVEQPHLLFQGTTGCLDDGA